MEAALPALPVDWATGRDRLQAVAVRVVGTARFLATGHMGLAPWPGGFGTPPGDPRRVGVVAGTRVGDAPGALLVVDDRSAPLTTLGAAAALAGVDIDAVAPHEALALDRSPDTPVDVDEAVIATLAAWYATVAGSLDAQVQATAPGDDPSSAQLWPEHFDLALEIGPAGHRANLGGSPGDGFESGPYLYVGPHEPRTGPFWNAPFGAVLRYADLLDGADPAAFFAEGRAVLLAEG